MYHDVVSRFFSSVAPFTPSLFRNDLSDEDRFREIMVLFEYKAVKRLVNPWAVNPFEEMSRWIRLLFVFINFDRIFTPLSNSLLFSQIELFNILVRGNDIDESFG